MIGGALTVRAYEREHSDMFPVEAHAAAAARSGHQPSLPARASATPPPRPAERLEGYTRRAAAAAGVQQHRAMEPLSLEPGIFILRS